MRPKAVVRPKWAKKPKIDAENEQNNLRHRIQTRSLRNGRGRVCVAGHFFNGLLMNNETPYKVAVLLATYNGEKFLVEFLDSLCRQTFKEFCLYIRDDGSADKTIEILQSYKSRLKLRFLSAGERLGPAIGFLQIMREADGAHGCYLLADQDDYWYEDKIERAWRALNGMEDEVALYCSRLEYVDENLNYLGLSRVPKKLSFQNALVENVATGCTIAFSRRLRSEVFTSNPYDVIMHDWWLYMYCTAFGHVVYDPKPSIKYRQHQNNSIGAATSFWDDFHRRWVRFRRRDGGVHWLSRQSKAFLACYGNRLLPEHRVIIERLVIGIRDPLTRCMLALRPPVFRQRPIDNFILRCLFLIGRY